MGYREKYFDSHKTHGGWHKCAECGKSFRKDGIDIDHIIPQKWGGPDALWNLQSMCKHHNRSKGADLSNTPRDLFRNAFSIITGKSWR